MKVSDLLEMFSTPPQSPWTPELVLKDMLGANRVAFDMDDDDEYQPGQYVVSRPWTAGMEAGMFSNMDCKPGEGGAIGLKRMYGRTPADIAAAAHEGAHAVLHMSGKDYSDEKATNAYAEAWLRRKLTGMFLHQALEELLKSKIHYGHN